MDNHSNTLTPPPQPLKFITGADFNGCSIKDSLVSYLRSLNYEVEDLGVGSYYSIGDQVAKRVAAEVNTARGLLACGTGTGVQIFANKTPGIYAATCLTVDDAKNARSINNANVLAVSGMSTSSETAIEILETFIKTSFKSPCPASGNKDWDPEIMEFLDKSVSEMAEIGKSTPTGTTTDTAGECAICCLAKNREFVPVELMPGV